MKPLPAAGTLTIGFAHAAYQLEAEFKTRSHAAASREWRDLDALKAGIADVDVLVVSGTGRNELIAAAPRLRFIQSVNVGTDQYDKAGPAAVGIRLASAQGANERAVSEHAMALMAFRIKVWDWPLRGLCSAVPVKVDLLVRRELA